MRQLIGVIMMMNDENKQIEIDNNLLSKITKKIVRLERENSVQKDKNDPEMVKILKRVIEGEVK